MNTMGIIGFIFGIFGLMAYCSMGPLKRRIEVLESALSKMEGTAFHENRESLFRVAQDCIGCKVKIELKEDHEDIDIGMYGNSKHGSNIILDADRDWMAVEVDGPKGSKTKLIRMESIRNITKE